MINKQKFDTQLGALHDGLQQKLGMRGRSFAQRVKRAGRLLPKHVRLSARTLIEAEQKINIPRLATQIDQPSVAKAFKTFGDHLSQIDPKERRRTIFLNWLGGLVFNLLLVLGATLLLMWWLGFI